MKRLGIDKFLVRARKVHNEKFDYSLVKYKNFDINIKIICSTHGTFEQTPRRHLLGNGCKKCAVKAVGVSRRLSKEELLDRFQKLHGNRYDYSLVDYQGETQKIKIICRKHGLFMQRVIFHLKRCGCPICKNSKGECSIRLWLKENNYEFIQGKKFAECKAKRSLPFDFYLPKEDICIEYDGEFHYKAFDKSINGAIKFKMIRRHDRIKDQFCKENVIPLIRIPYWKREKINEILDNKVRHL